MTQRLSRLKALGACALLGMATPACVPAGYGAALIVRTFRYPRFVGELPPHRDITVRTPGVTLRGWLFEPPSSAPLRGLIVYLHGKDHNLTPGLEVARRFVPHGYAVLTYDQRAHGDSSGRYCTYGVYEKADLRHVLDAINPTVPVVLIGHSLGAAVALQEAPDDPRVHAVIAISSFSTLEQIIQDRTPSLMSHETMMASIREAERLAHFRVSQASPLSAASRLNIPVLLIHGTSDPYTSPEHSKRIYGALPAPTRKALLLVEGAGHVDVVHDERTWKAIEAWLENRS